MSSFKKGRGKRELQIGEEGKGGIAYKRRGKQERGRLEVICIIGKGQSTLVPPFHFS